MARKVNITLPKVSDLVLQVKLEGEWQRVEALVSNLGPSMQRGYDKAVGIFSKPPCNRKEVINFGYTTYGWRSNLATAISSYY